MGKAYFRILFFLYAAALLVCGASRVYLRLYGIDLDTGFYTQVSPLVPLFNIVLASAVVLMILLNRLRVTNNEYPLPRDGVSEGLLALLVGISIFLFVMEDTGWLARYIPVTGTPLRGFSVWLCGVLGCVAALFFVWLGLRGIAGKKKPPNGVFALLPPIWQVVLLVAKFNSYPTLTTISDNLLTVLYMLFSAVFMVGYARTICGFSRKDGRNYTISTGLAASLMGFLLVIPNYLYMLLNGGVLPAPSLGYMESLYVLIFSIYEVTTVIRLRKSIAIV